MKVQTFLEHHGISVNPFADEEAQTDPVFQSHCIFSTRHPSWDKIFGNPSQPSTSIVFGEKGAGKTAMRIQIARHLQQYNAEHPAEKLFVIEYDDLNPFLDRFRERASSAFGTPVDRALKNWRLWDHIDAILSLGTTEVVDELLASDGKADSRPDWRRPLVRDVMLLTACYDQSLADTFRNRWNKLQRRMGFSTWKAEWDVAVGIVGTLIVLGVTFASGEWATWLAHPWVYLAVFAAWIPWIFRFLRRWMLAASIVRHMRVGMRETGPLRNVLMRFTNDELSGHPFPNKQRSDDRYELLQKFFGVVKQMGYSGVIVIVDRVDEPDLVGGSAERMKAIIWPMLDNKFLKQKGLGVKLLLPIELTHFIDKEDSAFYQRSRLDKQNLIRSLEWTGEALYDLASSRLEACSAPGKKVPLQQLFDPQVSERRLLDAFRSLRVPRHLFKFMYRLLMAHCNAYTDAEPVWKISAETFETSLALYRRDQEAFDQGLRGV